MDQFNKILAGFLVLFVALGLATLVFVRLGLLNRIFKPTEGIQNVATMKNQTPTPSPLVEQTQTAKQGEENNSLLGFLFPKHKTPTPSPQNNKDTMRAGGPTKITPLEQKETTQPNEDLYVTIIPYRSTQPTTYPASGPSQGVIFLASALLPLGLYLKLRYE